MQDALMSQSVGRPPVFIARAATILACVAIVASGPALTQTMQGHHSDAALDLPTTPPQHHAVAGIVVPGQDALGAVQEICQLLEPNPQTACSTFTFPALREPPP